MPTITIDFTQAQADRFADAWEKKYGERPTLQQVKQHLISEMRGFVYHVERKAAEQDIQIPTFDPS